MRTVTALVAILVSMTFVVEATAQRQAPPAAEPSTPSRSEPTQGQPVKTVEGQVESVDSSLTVLTLTDGTRLVTPPGVEFKPGAITEGMTVIASYREENGTNVLTDLAVGDASRQR
jgi:Protein of unknown function (DUF1344)